MDHYYQLTEIEVTEPLTPLAIDAAQCGVGLILRCKGVPVGFVLRSVTPGTVLSSEWLATAIEEEAGEQIVQEGLRRTLRGADAAGNPPTPLSLTVCVCTRDHPELAARAVASLQNVLLPGTDRVSFYEILVVDNAPSDDRTRDMVQGLADSRVRYTREPLPGLDFARNRGVAVARGDIIAFVDDDAVADAAWLEGLTEAWSENPDAGCFTGLVLPLVLNTPAQVTFEERGGFRRGFTKIRYGATLAGNPLYPSGNGFGVGANMAFRRDALRDIGGFDEALDTGAPLPGGGDLDIFYRMVRSGRKLVYEPRFLVFHEHRATHKALRRQYYTWGLGFMAFLRKAYRISKNDRRERIKLGFVTRWFFFDGISRLVASLRRRNPLTPDLVVAELVGGVIGIFGEYERSERRTARLREKIS